MNEEVIELTDQQQAIEDGRSAKAILENEIFQTIFDVKVKALQDKLDGLEPFETNSFTQCAIEKDCLRGIISVLKAFVEAGKQAETETKDFGIQFDGVLA